MQPSVAHSSNPHWCIESCSNFRMILWDAANHIGNSKVQNNQESSCRLHKGSSQEKNNWKSKNINECKKVRSRKSGSAVLCMQHEQKGIIPTTERPSSSGQTAGGTYRPRRTALHFFWIFLCSWVACSTPTNMKTNPPQVHRIWIAHPLAFVGKIGSLPPLQ